MSGGVDGFDAGQAEIPEQIGLDEGCEEGAAGSIDVNGDVKACACLQLVEGVADFFDRLELQGEGDAEGDDDADGVLVAALNDFFGSEQETVAFHGDLADLDIEVTAELVPADLDGAHDEVWSFG